MKRSHSSYFLFFFALLLFLSLVGFFVYATQQYQQKLFVILASTLLVSLVLLIPFRHRLMKKSSQADLEKQNYLERYNLLKADIDKDREIVESLRKKIVSYSQLKGLTEKLSMCLSLEETSHTFSKEISHLFWEKGSSVILYLLHVKSDKLCLSSSQKGQVPIDIKEKNGDAFDQWVVKTLQPLLIEDIKKDFRFDSEKTFPGETRIFRSLMGVPMMIEDKLVGVLRLDSQQANDFSMEDLRFLNTIADLGALAIANAQLYERLKDLAIKDSLTGLYLRRYFLERLDQEIPQKLRCEKSLSFLMIDLDKFKQYNDQFGHVAGDIVLRTIGKILSDVFKKPGDLVARYGGEEFAVVLPDCSKDMAVCLAEQLRDKVKSKNITLRRVETNVTVSIGVATLPQDAKVKEALINRADQALYKAKNQGRDQVCVA